MHVTVPTGATTIPMVHVAAHKEAVIAHMEDVIAHTDNVIANRDVVIVHTRVVTSRIVHAHPIQCL